jgi:cobalamin biosynthesis Co2+ chelatase CbiK
MEVNPIARQNGDLTVFKGVSSPGVESHFSYVQGQGYHVSTYLKGLGKIDQINF